MLRERDCTPPFAPHDTLHVLIKDYRDTHKVILNVEHKLMLQMAPELVGSARPVDGRPAPGSAQDPPAGWSLEGAAPCAWLTDDLSATGVIGDARQASADLGLRLQERLIRHWQKRFLTLLASDWPPTQSLLP